MGASARPSKLNVSSSKLSQVNRMDYQLIIPILKEVLPVLTLKCRCNNQINLLTLPYLRIKVV